MSRIFGRAAAVLFAAAAAGAGCGAEPADATGLAPLPLTVELRTRALVPGEPFRIVVSSPEKLVRLEARVLDRDVFMAPSANGGGETWLGWGLVPLGQNETVATVDVLGTTSQGRAARGVLAIEVGAKDFPVEELTVASKYVSPPAEVTKRLAEERARLKELYLDRAAPVAGGPFVAPVPGDPTSIFGTKRILNGEPRDPHPGLDLRAAEGETVVSSGAGTIALARDLYYSGNTVIVDHGGGLFTLYAHLSRIDVGEGERVDAGASVGLSGSTGRVTGPHLHWGAKIGDAPFDPRALLDPRLFP